MFQYLEKLRRKPEGERRKAIFLISLSVTAVIAIIWGIGLSLRVSDTDFSIQKENSVEKKAAPSISETFSNFMKQVGDIIDGGTTYENPTE